MGGNIIGVGSKIKKPSLRIYLGGDTYQEWEFIWNPTGQIAVPGQTPQIRTQIPLPLQTGPSERSYPNGINPNGANPNGTNPNPPDGQQPPQDRKRQSSICRLPSQ